MTVSVPAILPVTIPVEPTDALAPVVLHVPPVTVSVNVVADPRQTFVAPEIDPGLAVVLTNTCIVTVSDNVPSETMTRNESAPE
jgi:hypothetical protein